MPDQFVLLEDVRRIYREGDNTHPVLLGVSLSVKRGETIALLGRSGSGKSTLLNVISGIDRVDEGQVIVDGINLTALSESQLTMFRRRNIGFVYQFFNLVPTLTALENIALVLELNKFPAREIPEKSPQEKTDAAGSECQRAVSARI